MDWINNHVDEIDWRGWDGTPNGFVAYFNFDSHLRKYVDTLFERFQIHFLSFVEYINLRPCGSNNFLMWIIMAWKSAVNCAVCSPFAAANVYLLNDSDM